MRRLAAVALLVMLAPSGLCQAEDSEIDALLTRWSLAATRCESLDAKVRHWSYDLTFDDKSYGELEYFFDAENNGRFQLSDKVAVVWRDGTTLWIDFERKSYHQFTPEFAAKVREAESSLLKESSDWFRGLRRQLIRNFHRFTSCRKVFPFLLLADAEDLHSQYELTIEPREKDTLLRAVAKPSASAGYESLEFLFRPGEGLPYAVRLAQSASQYDVYQFDLRVNGLPENHEALINPDVSSLRLIQ